LIEEEFIPQIDVAEGEADAADSSAISAQAAAQGGDDPSGPNGRERQSLAQKVRNWLGRAAQARHARKPVSKQKSDRL
jgi:hypothetical protein